MQASDKKAWEYEEPITFTEWAVLLKETGELALGMTEELARLTSNGRDDVLLVSRVVTCEPWRVQGEAKE